MRLLGGVSSKRTRKRAWRRGRGGDFSIGSTSVRGLLSHAYGAAGAGDVAAGGVVDGVEGDEGVGVGLLDDAEELAFALAGGDDEEEADLALAAGAVDGGGAEAVLAEDGDEGVDVVAGDDADEDDPRGDPPLDRDAHEAA